MEMDKIVAKALKDLANPPNRYRSLQSDATKKFEVTLNEQRTISIRRWTLRPNQHVVQVLIGKVEIRSWRFPKKSQAEEKYNFLFHCLTENNRGVIV